MTDSHAQHATVLQGIRTGDPAVLDKLYTDEFPRIASFVRSNNGTEDDARDLFQDAVMVLYNKSRDPGFRLTSTVFTFLYAVCRNLWLKKLRKKEHQWVTNTEDMVSIDDTAEVLEVELLQQARFQLYRRKLQEIGAQCQELMRLSLSGMRVREIVARMQFSSEEYARKRKFKCKEKLIRLVRQDPDFHQLSREDAS